MASLNTAFTPAYILGWIVKIIARSTDILLVGQSWIYSPSSTNNDPVLHAMLPSPLMTSIIYALAETVFIRFYLWIHTTPLILLTLAVLIHSFGLQGLQSLLSTHTRAQRARPPADPHGNQERRLPPESRVSPRTLSRGLIIATLTAAASNAAILLTFSALPAQRWDNDTGEWTKVCAELAGILKYLANCMEDVVFGIRTYRGIFLGQQGSASLAAMTRLRSSSGAVIQQISCLLVLQGVKLMGRGILGVDVRIAFRTLSPQYATELFGPQTYEWLGRFFDWFAPVWWWQVICLFILIVTLQTGFLVFWPEGWSAMRQRSRFLRWMFG